jgi:hypothetical protein
MKPAYFPILHLALSLLTATGMACTAPVRGAAPARQAATSPPPPALAIDGKGCVRDPIAHAATITLTKYRKRLEQELGRGALASDLTDRTCSWISPLPDLDDDGAPDLEVKLCYPSGGHARDHYLYFSGHGCPRFADHLLDGPLAALPTRHLGVRDLESNTAGGCAGADFTWQRRVWTGAGYQVVDTATCLLCDELGLSRPGPRALSHPVCQRAWAEMRTRR